MILATTIFFITLIFIIVQPKGLQIGTSAILGAIIALLFGVVSFSDVLAVTAIVWDATLAFLGIIILSMVLDQIGFFEWCAIKMARLSDGNVRLMFVYSLLLGALVSALFANDGAALILTPILLSKMKILRLDMKTIVAFLLAGGFISDSASLPFVFSNLTNIVTADYFSIGFVEYFLKMSIPFVVSVIASIVVLYFLLASKLPKQVDISLLEDENAVIRDKKLFRLSWFFLIFLFFGYIVGDIYHIPVSVFALGGGVVFFAIALHFKAIIAKDIIQNAPWQIVWFSIGLYIVVYGLKNAGLTTHLTAFLENIAQYGDFVLIITTGFVSAFFSAVMNNMPTIMIMDIATTNMSHLAYANIVGANLGPKMTPFGSLATLLWLHVLQNKGVKIDLWHYTKFGLIVTPPVLFLVLVSIYFWK